ncbi:virulence factor BrkB family protein [Pseudomonas sp. LS44]|uniref:virulence factor BrkB family protein n=1 Tax=Pseudomonas sp. LS44 TaxID=1357074 RepID=UPI00215B09F4|nr:virulence factor BrkB family protein [Pseudomonas sp. LS44]UVE16610.1 virulence factor BrkB family protein [Pseudomonas sp. LS44]
MRQGFAEMVEFWRFLAQRFIDDRAPNSAAALTYTTLFAVVPMMTVTFAMLSAIPVFQGVGEQIQSFILRNFLPASGETVRDYLASFTAQARQLTWLGVIFLVVTAFTMLVTVERAFNTIWRVRQPRRGVSSFLLYWAILSLGPLLLGVGFVVSTYIASLSLISGPDALIGARTLLGFAPLMSSIAAFTLIYATVPNTRVPFKHALIGGVLAAVLFELAKMLFGLYVRLFPGYQLIYGAFATVPLFLLWVYLSWLIVLLGAELVCNLSSSWQWRRRAVPRLLVILGVLRVFHDSQLRGELVSHRKVQNQGWLLPEDEWDEILDFLEGEQLICRASGGAWVLCRDLSNYSLAQLISRSPWPLPRLEQLPKELDESWYAALRSTLENFHRQQHDLFGASLAQWLQTHTTEAPRVSSR